MQIPDVMLLDGERRRLTPCGTKVYNFLAKAFGFDKKFTTTFEYIANGSGVSLSTAKRVVPHMERVGFLDKFSNGFNVEKNINCPNSYILRPKIDVSLTTKASGHLICIETPERISTITKIANIMDQTSSLLDGRSGVRVEGYDNLVNEVFRLNTVKDSIDAQISLIEKKIANSNMTVSEPRQFCSMGSKNDTNTIPEPNLYNVNLYNKNLDDSKESPDNPPSQFSGENDRIGKREGECESDERVRDIQVGCENSPPTPPSVDLTLVRNDDFSNNLEIKTMDDKFSRPSKKKVAKNDDFEHVSEINDDEVCDSPPEPVKRSERVLRVLTETKRNTEIARDAKTAKQAKKAKSLATKKPKKPNISQNMMNLWIGLVREKFGVVVPPFMGKERNIMKSIYTRLGEQRTIELLEYAVSNWDELRTRYFKLKDGPGYPDISKLVLESNNIVLEMENGVRPMPVKPKPWEKPKKPEFKSKYPPELLAKVKEATFNETLQGGFGGEDSNGNLLSGDERNEYLIAYYEFKMKNGGRECPYEFHYVVQSADERRKNRWR